MSVIDSQPLSLLLPLTFLAAPWAVMQESHLQHHDIAVVGAEACSGSSPATPLGQGFDAAVSIVSLRL